MGVIGQLPGSPEELPGREVSSGEPPFEPDRGPRADELPTIAPSTRTIDLPLASSVPVDDAAGRRSEDEPGGA